jgi:AcrR family transcriptional regulator
VVDGLKNGGIMKRYNHLRITAREMHDKGMTLDEIAKKMSLSRSTVFYWIRNMEPLSVPRAVRSGALKIARAVYSKKCSDLRDSAYQSGKEQFSTLVKETGFRDFVVMYMAEGYKRGRNSVNGCNSEPEIVKLFSYWITKLTTRPDDIYYEIQHYRDNEKNEMTLFWTQYLGVSQDRLRFFMKKSRKGLQLHEGAWRCLYGVVSVRINDTYLRSKLDAWMDEIKREWKEEMGTLS